MHNIDQVDQHFMEIALEQCRLSIDAGQSPFGACVVINGELIAAAHNHVYADTDITAHAEIVCLREACTRMKAILLTGATLYSTTEPCPMCFSASHWARVERIVYAAGIEDARYYGFNEMQLNNDVLAAIVASPIDIRPHVMRDEAIELFRRWRDAGGKPY